MTQQDIVYELQGYQSEDPKKGPLESYDVVTLKDNHGKVYKLHFGFYHKGEAFWFNVVNYEKFIQFVNKQKLPKDYDITNLNNIQDLIHKYDDSLYNNQ